jgi:amino acid transporter
MVAIIIINLFGVRGYGEFESAASMIKIIAVVGFIILGIIIDVGGQPGGEYLGARTWHDPGAFANGFQGFVSIFVTAAFAFAGTELVGLAAAETGNPRKEVPKACKQIFWRILIFYIVTLFLIGLIVPYTEPRLKSGASSYDARASPFVIAIENAGISTLPSIFNAVILISVLSVGNSAVFGASRTLCGLAQSGQAPKIFAYIDREGRPLPAVALSLIMGALAFLVYSGEDANNTVFNWLLALSGLSSIFSWGSINLAKIRFRRAWAKSGRDAKDLPWTSPVGVAGSYFGFGFNILVLIFQFIKAAWPIGYPSGDVGTRVSDFFQSYLAFPVVILCFLIYKVVKRTRYIRIDEIDLTTGRRDPMSRQELDREREELAARPLWKRVLSALC